MIGVFGGTFDPIHFGHINLALQLKEHHNLKEVWFCPAGTSPFKKDCVTTGGVDRLAMVELAIEGIPGFYAVDTEIKRGGISYTIDTLRILKSQTTEELALILGSDMIGSLPAWHQPHEIVKIASLLVGTRLHQGPPESLRAFPDIWNAVLGGWTPIPQLDISSTDVRLRLSQKKYCSHLVPGKVLDYISCHGLYL